VNPPGPGVNPPGLPRVPEVVTGYRVLPRDTFTGRQRRGLAALIALATLQVLASTPVVLLGDDTEVLTAGDVLRAAA
jgi:hypothetical protein